MMKVHEITETSYEACFALFETYNQGIFNQPNSLISNVDRTTTGTDEDLFLTNYSDSTEPSILQNSEFKKIHKKFENREYMRPMHQENCVTCRVFKRGDQQTYQLAYSFLKFDAEKESKTISFAMKRDLISRTEGKFIREIDGVRHWAWAIAFSNEKIAEIIIKESSEVREIGSGYILKKSPKTEDKEIYQKIYEMEIKLMHNVLIRELESGENSEPFLTNIKFFVEGEKPGMMEFVKSAMIAFDKIVVQRINEEFSPWFTKITIEYLRSLTA